MFTIVIVDYGMGNLRSVQKAFETCGCDAELSRNARTVEDADALVVPGVGSFGDCVENLDRFGLKGAIGSFLKSGRPYLGICLGLQILFESSEESESSRGLGVFPGCVRRFRGNRKIPHMGWNTIRITGRDGTRCPLFRGIGDGAYFYFVHSYYPVPDDAEVIAAVTDYDGEFASTVWRDNIIATQFHPEKSQRLGLKLIKNFIDVVRGKG